MGIFSRFSDIINSNISSILDKAENPEKMIRLIIQEMEDTLVEVRTHSAKSIADQKTLNRRVESIEAQIADWQDKASLAITKGREDLARAALIEKQKLEESLQVLKSEKALVEETLQRLADETQKLENKISETRARQQALVIRRQSAIHRRDISSQLHDGKTEEALSKFAQYERKIDELEAQAESYNTSAQAKDLSQEFAELKADDEIEQAPAKLKQEMAQKQKDESNS
ncbi:MAG: phage shock protein PspA [Vibrio sp.]